MNMEELEFDELRKVDGGSQVLGSSAGVEASHFCPNCQKVTQFIVFSGARGKCKECGTMVYDL